MTAEVGVLNSLGVALAADSAISIGREADKIYTSANKIFQLSCTAPIATMVYGNANLVGLPWETVVKVYRTHLGERRFDTVQEYATDFLSFVGNGPHGMFPEEQQDGFTHLVVFSLFEEVAEGRRRTMVREIQKGKKPEETDLERLLAEQVDRFLEYARGQDFLPGFSSADVAAIEERYGKGIEQAITAIFGSKTTKRKIGKALKSLAAEALCRNVPTDMRAGLVVTGFGEKEYTPALVAYQIEEMALGRLRCLEVSRMQIDVTSNPVAVMPFAQQEMVYSFMEGVDEGLLDFMQGSTRDLFTGVVDEIVRLVSKADTRLGASLQQAIAPKVPELIARLFEGWTGQRGEFWKPVLNITRSLPKDELAAMAEALVNLTKFRRRVTTARETVGGPIDVAVITKGDGFVWVKRKHYFDPEFNPRAMARYQKGG